MNDLKKWVRLLNLEGKEEWTPKELKEKGLSRYKMEKLIQKGFLKKVRYGHYRVKRLNNYRAYRKFCIAVKMGNYIDAYNALVDNYYALNNHDYDTHLLIYIKLLKELLGSNYDFSMMDDLYAFSYLEKDSFLHDFIQFREEVMAGNYELAERHLDKYKKKELEKFGFYHTSTYIFSKLIADVNKKRLNEKLHTELSFNTEMRSFKNALYNGNYEKALEYLEKALILSVDDEVLQYKKILETIGEMDKQGTVITSKHIKYGNMDCFEGLSTALKAEDYPTASKFVDDCIKENDSSYYRLIKMLLYHAKRVSERNRLGINVDSLPSINYLDVVEKWLKEENDEETLETLQKCLDNPSYNRFNSNIKNIISMIEKIRRMRNQKELLDDYAYDYSECNNETDRLNQVLQNKDYQVALKLIGPLTIETSSKTLGIMKKIMHKMNALDKKNRELIRLAEEKQRLLKEKKQEERKTLEIQKEEPITLIDTPIIVEEKVEVKEEAEPFDEAILYDLIYNREYEKAMQLLKIEYEKADNWSQLYNVTLSMLKQWEKMNTKRVTLGFDHKYASTFSLSIFFEAIRAKDYETAYHILPVAQELARNKSDFEVYKMILEDIVPIAEDIKKLDEVTESINQMMSSLGEENIEDLLQLIEKKITVEKSLGYRYDKDEILVQIIDMILIVQRNKLDSSYFLRLVDKSDSNQNYLLPSIHNGDYLRAKEILLKIDWNNIVEEGKFTFYDLKNMKRLLYMFESTLLKNEIHKEPEKVDEIPPIEEPLKGLRVFVKHRYFNEALKEILGGKYQVEDIDIIIQLILTELVCQNVSKTYEEHFAKILENGDSLEALKILNEYDSFIENYHLSKNTEKERQMLKK